MERNHQAFQLWEKGKVQEAIELLFLEIEKKSNNQDSYYNLASILTLSHKYDDAEAVLETAIKKYPDEDIFLYAFGNLNYKKEEFQKALDYYKKIKRLENDTLKKEAVLMLGQTYFAMKQPKKALVYLLQIEMIPSDDTTLLMMIGNCFLQTGFFKEAESRFKQVSEIEKENSDAWFRLGVCNYAESNKEKAEFYFEQAKQVDPSRFIELLAQFKEIEQLLYNDKQQKNDNCSEEEG